MLKITLQISKEEDKCNVKVITPKKLSEADEDEKIVCAMVYNEITKAIQKLEN